MTTPSQTLWVDKYRPRTLQEFVWASDAERQQFQAFIDDGHMPHLLLAGPPGVGKTSLAKLLLDELKVEECNRLFISASKDGNIETVRTTIMGFITNSTWSDDGGLKYILLDEADGLSFKAQESLRTEINEYSNSVRWILTANRLSAISHPLQDRCVIVKREAPSRDQYSERLISILMQEADLDADEVVACVSEITASFYPSIRKGITALQTRVRNRSVGAASDAATGGSWREEALALYLTQDLLAARTLIAQNTTATDIADYFVWLAGNLDIFADQGEAIILIAEGMYRHAFVADPEINLSATMVKLSRIGLN